MVGLCGLEPQTLRLSGVRSNHLSYRPAVGDGSHPASPPNDPTIERQAAMTSRVRPIGHPQVDREEKKGSKLARDVCRRFFITPPSLETSRLVIPRKEVIQPQVPLRLPCYDLVPITELTVGASLLAVGYTTSGTPSFRGLTGGVYKAQEHIHRGVADPRLLAIPASWRRIAASNPNWDQVWAICLPSLVCVALSRPLWHVCSPGHKGHDDLTSSPPSSVLTTAVSLESPA